MFNTESVHEKYLKRCSPEIHDTHEKHEPVVINICHIYGEGYSENQPVFTILEINRSLFFSVVHCETICVYWSETWTIERKE